VWGHLPRDAEGTCHNAGMGALYGLFGVGFVAMFWGIAIGAYSGADSPSNSLPTVVTYSGVLAMAVAIIGMAGLRSRRRERERQAQRRELARR
jgi:hypothetical protein